LCAKIRAIMFLRQTRRQKDGKTHVYWNIGENRRLDDGRVVQRQVLYLGEINASQAAAWRKAIEVFDEASGEPRILVRLWPFGRYSEGVGWRSGGGQQAGLCQEMPPCCICPLASPL
jgi:hypothetical protein